MRDREKAKSGGGFSSVPHIIATMTEDRLLLPVAETSLKRAWRPWKGVGLAAFVLAILLNRWLPGIVVAFCYLLGIVLVFNLLFHLLRYLKNRLFWRVRYRIIGSFIFVGLLPLILILGIVYLTAYVFMGQLSANYLETSMRELQNQVSVINMELAQQLHPPASESALRLAADKVFKRHSGEFPIMAAILARRRPDGSFELVGRYDPKEVNRGIQDYPAEKWLGGKESFEGFLLRDETGLLSTLRPVSSLGDCYLDVSVPVDRHIETLLKDRRDIYVAFSGFGKTVVQESRTGIQVRVEDEKDRKSREEFGAKIGELQSRRAFDTRRMTSWGAVLEGRDFATGEKKPAALAFIRVPYKTLYGVYLSGSFAIGSALLKIIAALLVFFVIAELVSVVVGATISRRITRSIHDMYIGTLALQKGDLQHRIPVRLNDQLGMLAQSFNQMSASINRLLEEVSEKKRLEQELEIAREVQETLFPKLLPHPRGLSVFGGCEPARVVSGDYYDFIHEDDARLHIVVGDISGKGISAALLMANLQAAMRNQISAFHRGVSEDVERSLAEVMRQLNTQIFLNSPSEKYATLFAGRYDAETRRLCYCNAGHLPPILLHDGGIDRLETGGTVLGLFEAADYKASSIELTPGTVFAIFTDGVTEAVNSGDEEYGEARLIEALRESSSHSPEGIYRHVTAQVRLWQGALKQHDDITLIVGKVG